MKKICFSIVSFLLISICIHQLAYSNGTDTEVLEAKLAIVVQFEEGKPSFSVNSVKLKEAYLLDELANIYGDSARNTSVSILLHEEVPLIWLRKLLGIVGKIGAKEIRFYYFDDYKETIGEIKLLNTQPFTLNPK